MVRPTFEPKYQAFLVKLRQAMEEAGMAQVEVAARLGKPQSYVSKCESDERRIDVIELAVFAALYDKPLEFFLPQSFGS